MTEPSSRYPNAMARTLRALRAGWLTAREVEAAVGIKEQTAMVWLCVLAKKRIAVTRLRQVGPGHRGSAPSEFTLAREWGGAG